MKREDIAAALAAVAVIKVTAAKGSVTEERKNATLLAAKMLEAGTWDTDATLSHAVALAVQAAREWKQVAPLMDNAKKAANTGLYALSADSADNISNLTESMVGWKIPSAPATQAIGAEDDGGWKFSNASGQALAADITCLCPSADQTNECIKIQSSGNVIPSAVTDKRTAIEAWQTLKKYCIAPMRGRATQGSLLASIAHLKAMLGTNTGATTTGTDIPHITHALGQQGQPTSDKQGIKFVTYGAYAAGKIPWEQALIDAGTAIDKARRLADHAANAADLALGLVTTWAPVQRNESGRTERRDAKETDNRETHRTNERAREKAQHNTTPNTAHACAQTGGTWNEGRCQSTAHHAEGENAHADNAHTIQHATRAGMMLAALVVKTPQ
ncbi:variant surface glycoprotein, (VSG), putative [Trypanosoma vivax Y486]|uniref:Variant surface glycoprotein, (VSG), putative n=1 Tax=Trypanosoma vivax (strain Y486) TaxID=1055687 RepID=F9WR09_TRYVY|nr:variant surface glycoprotein, (VSG), putative [Trypanosoma vivax Y486]|eukprot:CCD19992.1 variant surface glycoprotein, (VSG), putative [Trypanosoma vivax Y486]